MKNWIIILFVVLMGCSKAENSFLTEVDPMATFREDNRIGRDMLLFCINSKYGKESKIGKRMGAGGFNSDVTEKSLKLDHGKIIVVYDLNSEGINPILIGDPDDLICDAVKKFGKNGSLRVFVAPFRMPHSCENFSITERDDNGFVTISIEKDKK